MWLRPAVLQLLPGRGALHLQPGMAACACSSCLWPRQGHSRKGSGTSNSVIAVWCMQQAEDYAGLKTQVPLPTAVWGCWGVAGFEAIAERSCA